MRYEDGDLATAKRLCKRCLDIFEDIGGVTDALLILAQIYAAEGNVEKAATMAQKALFQFHRLGIRESLAETEILLARLQDRIRDD